MDKQYICSKLKQNYTETTIYKNNKQFYSLQRIGIQVLLLIKTKNLSYKNNGNWMKKCIVLFICQSSKSNIERSAFLGVSFFGCFLLDDGGVKLAVFLLPVHTQINTLVMQLDLSYLTLSVNTL